MRRMTLIVSIALLMFGLIGSQPLLADDGDDASTMQQSGTIENNSQGQTDSESEGLLEEILDAVRSLLGVYSDNPEDPVGRTHPSDYNPPTPEGDDGGWGDQTQ